MLTKKTVKNQPLSFILTALSNLFHVSSQLKLLFHTSDVIKKVPSNETVYQDSKQIEWISGYRSKVFAVVKKT
jgi:hypothetical protein